MEDNTTQTHRRRGKHISRRYKRRQRLRLIIIIGLVLLLALLASFVSLFKMSETAPIFHLDYDCVLGEETCVAISGEKKIVLTTNVKPASMEAITFTTTLTNVHADHIILDLQGKKMFMGINQVDMTKVSDNTWQATIELAVCTTGSMTWLASLLIHNENLAYPTRAEFEFTAR